jgi:hypothetical protein
MKPDGDIARKRDERQSWRMMVRAYPVVGIKSEFPCPRRQQIAGFDFWSREAAQKPRGARRKLPDGMRHIVLIASFASELFVLMHDAQRRRKNILASHCEHASHDDHS